MKAKAVTMELALSVVSALAEAEAEAEAATTTTTTTAETKRRRTMRSNLSMISWVQQYINLADKQNKWQKKLKKSSCFFFQI